MEKEKLAIKIKKFQEREEDFKKRLSEFESAFNKLSDVKTNFESEKKIQILT